MKEMLLFLFILLCLDNITILSSFKFTFKNNYANVCHQKVDFQHCLMDFFPLYFNLQCKHDFFPKAKAMNCTCACIFNLKGKVF